MKKQIVAEHEMSIIIGPLCAKKWKDLVDTFHKKIDKSGSRGGGGYPYQIEQPSGISTIVFPS